MRLRKYKNTIPSRRTNNGRPNGRYKDPEETVQLLLQTLF